VNRSVLVVTEDGFGKRTDVARYRVTGRRAKGVRAIAGRSPLVGALIATDEDELVLVTSAAKVERIAVADLPRLGRATRGVRLIRLQDGERVTAAALASDRAREAEASDVTVSEPLTEASGLRLAASSTARDVAVRRGRVALRDGEDFAAAVVLHSPGRPRRGDGARLAVPRDEWAASEVHKWSAYWCSHCGEQFDDPEAVYGHIDAIHAVGSDRANVTVSGGRGEASGAPIRGSSGPRACACGCGTPLRPKARRQARYVNATHRKRGERQRRQAA
jgi:hypothetical protein